MEIPNDAPESIPPSFTLQEFRDLMLRAEYYAAASQIADYLVLFVAYRALTSALEILIALFEDEVHREKRILDWMLRKKK